MTWAARVIQLACKSSAIVHHIPPYRTFVWSEFAECMQVRLASLVENCFNAVERISEYSELKEEAPTDIDGSKPDDWPSRGLVSCDSRRLPSNEQPLFPSHCCLHVALSDMMPLHL